MIEDALAVVNFLRENPLVTGIILIVFGYWYNRHLANCKALWRETEESWGRWKFLNRISWMSMLGPLFLFTIRWLGWR